jgi:hypothetical protein
MLVTCEPLGAVGDSCQELDGCATGICDLTLATPVCIELQPPGAVCDADIQCDSFICDGTCAAPGCRMP